MRSGWGGWIVNCRAIYPALSHRTVLSDVVRLWLTEPTTRWAEPKHPQPNKKTAQRRLFLLAGVAGFACFTSLSLKNFASQNRHSLARLFSTVRTNYPRCFEPVTLANKKKPPKGGFFFIGWGGWIRTNGWRNQNPLPYHLATPQSVFFLYSI